MENQQRIEKAMKQKQERIDKPSPKEKKVLPILIRSIRLLLYWVQVLLKRKF